MRRLFHKNQSNFTLFPIVVLTLWFFLQFSLGLECKECIALSSEGPGSECQALPKAYLERVKLDDERQMKSLRGNYTKVCTAFRFDDVSFSDGGPRVTVDIHMSQMMTQEREAMYERACVQEPMDASLMKGPLFKDLHLLSNATSHFFRYQFCVCRDKDYCNAKSAPHWDYFCTHRPASGGGMPVLPVSSKCRNYTRLEQVQNNANILFLTTTVSVLSIISHIYHAG